MVRLKNLRRYVNRDHKFRWDHTVVSCAEYFIGLSSDSPELSRTGSTFLGFLKADEQFRNDVASLPGYFCNEKIPATAMQVLIECAVKIIMTRGNVGIYGSRVIEKALKDNPDNLILLCAYTKLLAQSAEDFAKNFTVTDHKRDEKLVPVITYFNGPEQTRAIAAFVSFLTVSRTDYQKGVRMPDMLSPEQESAYMSVLAKFVNGMKNSSREGSLLQELFSVCVEIMRNFSETNYGFLKDRYQSICGDDAVYWALFERLRKGNDAEFFAAWSTPVHLSRLPYFCSFLITLVLLYGGGEKMKQGIERYRKKLAIKFGNTPVLDKLALFDLPLNFSFLWSEKESLPGNKEYRALLKAMKSVNPATTEQVGSDTQPWARDSFAWLDEDYHAYLYCHNKDIALLRNELLSAGGNIVSGKGKTRFVCVSQGAFSQTFTLDILHDILEKRGIRIYVVPGGFTWAKHPAHYECVALNTPHIDTVFNIIPAYCTMDHRMKVLIDPYYYAMVRDNPDFKRFLKEQGIRHSDIVVIDERELYLNLTNFTVLLDAGGRKMMLFNKDKGFTLPRLNLKKSMLVQPEIEIMNVASFNGSIRCLTNMYPEAYVKKGAKVTLAIQDVIQDGIRKNIEQFFEKNHELLGSLSRRWVNRLQVVSMLSEKTFEFDALRRILFVNIGANGNLMNQEDALVSIEQAIREISGDLDEELFMDVVPRHAEFAAYTTFSPKILLLCL